MIALAGGMTAFPDDDADSAAVLMALKGELMEPRRNGLYLYAAKAFGPVEYKLTIELLRATDRECEANFLRLVQQVTGEANAHLGGTE